MSGLIERFIRYAAGERSVAEHADDLPVALAGQLAGLDEAQAVADRGRRVTRAHDVVLGLGARREAGDATVLTNRCEAVAAAREQLVRVALMAHVPDDLVVWAPQDTVQRDGQLDGAERGAEVAADLADARQYRLAKLLREKRQFVLGEMLKVAGGGDAVEIPHIAPSIASPGGTPREGVRWTNLSG